MTTHHHSETPAEKGSTGRPARTGKAGAEHRVLSLQRQAGNRAVAGRIQSSPPIPIQREIYTDQIVGKFNLNASEEEVAKDIAFAVVNSGAPGDFAKDATRIPGLAAGSKGTRPKKGTDTAASLKKAVSKTKKATDFSTMSDEEIRASMEETKNSDVAGLSEREQLEADAENLEKMKGLKREIFILEKPAKGKASADLNAQLKNMTSEELQARLTKLQNDQKELQTAREMQKQLADLQLAKKNGFERSDREKLQAKIDKLKEDQKYQQFDNDLADSAQAAMDDPQQQEELMKSLKGKKGSMPKGYADEFLKAYEEAKGAKKKVGVN